MAFALLSRSRSKTQGSVKPAPKQKSARGQHSADPRSGFAKPVFQPQTAALPTVPVIQAKLKVGEPDDKFEEEADRVAELTGNDNGSILPSAVARSRSPVGNLQRLYGNQPVLQMRNGSGGLPAPSVPLRSSQSGILQRKCACGGAAGMSGECEECSKKQRLGLQTKLKINEPGDIYEQEADRVADQVMATPAHHAVSGAPPRIQRFAGQPTGQVGTAPASVDQALANPGRPLEPALRQDMEQRFGYDFSRVRVHSGAAAEQSARDVNAHAYTLGHNIVFGEGQYSPRTLAGQQLLAHELAHVAQQSRSAESNLIQRAPNESEAAAIGKELERPELKAWRASLEKKGYTVYTRQQFDKVEWLKNAIPSKVPRPDMVAVNSKTGKVIVGDVTAGPWSTTGLKPGDVRKLPHGIGGDVEKKLHIEKTIDRAQQISRHLPDDLKHCEVVAQDRWWQKGGHSREITVRKRTLVTGGKAPVGGSAPKRTSVAPVNKPKAPPPTKAPPAAPTPPAAAKIAPTAPKPLAKLPAAAKIDIPQVKTTPKHVPKPRPGLGSVAKWGKVSPFEAAMLYLDLHAAHFAALADVKQRAAIANDLLSRVEGLERGARELRKATDALRIAEYELPNYPLQTYEETGEMIVGAEELAYVEEYGQAAARIANDAMAARSELNKAIEGWDATRAQAEKTSDFTRKAAVEAVIHLELRFSNEGGNFRAYLVKSYEDAGRVENWARRKQYHASDILGTGWVPEWYTPPTP